MGPFPTWSVDNDIIEVSGARFDEPDRHGWIFRQAGAELATYVQA